MNTDTASRGTQLCRTYKMHTPQTSNNNQFTVCIILQCCILLFLHTYELVYMKKHSFNILLKLKYPDFTVLISGCKRKVLSLEEKLEMNILKETRDRVALLGDGHKEINIRDKDSVRKYMSMAGTTIVVNSIRTNFKVTE